MSKHYLNSNRRLTTFALRIVDLIVLVLSAYWAFEWKFGIDHSMNRHYRYAILIGCIVGYLLFSAIGLYTPMRGRAVSKVIAQIFVSWFFLAVLMSVLAFFSKTSIFFSREWFFIWMFSGFILAAFYRCVLLWLLSYMRASGFNLRHVVVIGSGKLAEQAISGLEKHRGSGLSISGVLGPVTGNADTKILNHVVEKIPDDLESYIKEMGIDEVWIALPLKKETLITELLHRLRFCTVNIQVVPDLLGADLLNSVAHEVAGVPVLQIRATPMQGASRLLKAIEDKVLSAIILICISPILLVLAIGVKLSSPGPVFYRQERISWNNRPFGMLKFRSMPVNAESKSGAVWAKSGENRATKFGAFLRKTSLDELPQFINVIKGDMSIVGPRPERPVFVEKFKDEIPGYMYKHMVKAGITGWAQSNGWRGDTDLKKRIEYDLYYIENWSLWFDLKIIGRTIIKGFINKNAY